MGILIFLIAVFFALNMGAPSFAGSFSTAVGSKAINRLTAQLFFIFFVVAGAVFFGAPVAKTLRGDIVPAEFLSTPAVVIILTAATLSLFTANLMHIPQSTSLSVIAAIAGVGIFYQQINAGKIQYLLVCWAASIIISFALIFLAARYMYPPRKSNFWIYEKFVHHTRRLKWIVNFTSFYKAFAQGSNNVANAVAPLTAAGFIGTQPGLVVMGILFGLGAFTFSGPFKTSSEKIVPMGLLTATVINLISGTITIIASKLGVPLPTVIVYTVAIFAIGSIKDGIGLTLDNPVTRKTFFTWCINPLFTLGVSFTLSWMFLERGLKPF